MALDWKVCESILSQSTCESVRDFSVQWGLYRFFDWVWENKKWLIGGGLSIVLSVIRALPAWLRHSLIGAAVACVLVPVISTVWNHLEANTNGSSASVSPVASIQTSPAAAIAQGGQSPEPNPVTNISPSLVEPSDGWNVKRENSTFSVYFIVAGKDAGVDDFIYGQLIGRQEFTPLSAFGSDLQLQAIALLKELEHRIPEPEPYRTSVGLLADQRVDVSIRHQFRSNRGQLQLEYFQILGQQGTANAQKDILNQVAINSLSASAQHTITQIDRLARETVNRRYAELLLRLSKQPEARPPK